MDEKHTIVCSCGIIFVPQDYYKNEKCFLCEETPEEKIKKERFSKMTISEKNEYFAQIEEDEINYNLIRLSH